jgi:hypothetical protein
MVNVEFLQSEPDCECDVPSLGIEKRFTPQFMRLICGLLYKVFPAFIFCQKHAVVLSSPSFGAICPVGADKMEDFP